MAASSSRGPDGAPTAKAARFDSDWEDKILAQGQYRSTLPDRAMPFVNRHSEVFQLLEANFRAVLELSSRMVKDFRGLKVCFAAQMFGSGKTTLGENFVKQLSDPGLKKYVEDRFAEKEKTAADDPSGLCELKEYHAAFCTEWELAKRAQTLYVDVGGYTVLGAVPGLVAKIAGVAASVSPEPVEALAEVVVRRAAADKSSPLFVHFDEVGSLGEGVLTLRDGVRRTWVEMNRLRGEAMPHVYFYLSGKGIPLTVLGQSTSPVGTKWIILDVLHENHIRTIREQLLPDCGAGLDCCLQKWTGGAPRLLLYCLRVLHHLRGAGPLGDDLDKQMEYVSDILSKIGAVASDVFVDARADQDLHEAWLHLMVLGQLQVPCRRDMKLRVGRSDFTIERLLGALNVYITTAKAEATEDAFCVHIMKLVERFVRERFSSDCRVPLFFGDVHTSRLDAAELLERLVEQHIIVRACMAPDGQGWNALLSPLLGGSQLATGTVRLNRGQPLVLMPGVSDTVSRIEPTANAHNLLKLSTLHSEDLSKFMAAVSTGHVYRPRAMSGSADSFCKQDDFILEIQDKSGVGDGLTLADIAKEVVKCVKGHVVVLLFVALKLNPSLERWVGDGVLTLKSGSYQEEAGSADGALMYKPIGGKVWTESISSGAWAKLKKGRHDGKYSELVVRTGLEVVVPSPAAVRQFLGEADFDIVSKLAGKKCGSADVPFISRFYGFDRGSGPPPAKLEDDTVVITVVHGEVTRKVKFSRASTAAEIEKAICLAVGINVGTVIRLRDLDDCDVAINGSLKPGVFNVTVVP